MALGAVEEDLLTVGAVAGVGGETQHCKQLLDQPTREFGFVYLTDSLNLP